jgi:hypothetical protein
VKKKFSLYEADDLVELLKTDDRQPTLETIFEIEKKGS